MFWFFGREARGILAPQPGIEPAPPGLEGKVSTTGPPGKSLEDGSACHVMKPLSSSQGHHESTVTRGPRGLGPFCFKTQNPRLSTMWHLSNLFPLNHTAYIAQLKAKPL